MRFLLPTEIRSLLKSAALSILLLTAGCATNSEVAAPATSTEQPASASPAPAEPVHAPPNQLTRSDTNALKNGVFAKLLATDMAAAWQEDASEVTVILAPFKDESGLNLHIPLDTVRSRLETSLVNTPNIVVLSPVDSELAQLFRDSEIPAPFPGLTPLFVKELSQAHTIHGSLSAAEPDAVHRTFTLTLRVLKAGHEGPLAEVSESLTLSYQTAQAAE